MANQPEHPKCRTLVASPLGEVLLEVASAATEVRQVRLDLALASDWYLGQARRDVVETVYRAEPGLDRER